MIQLHQPVKNMLFLLCSLALLLSLPSSFIEPIPITYAAAQEIPSISSNTSAGLEATSPVGTFRKAQCTVTIPKLTTQGDIGVWCGLGGLGVLNGAQKPLIVQAGIDACLDDNCMGKNCQPGVQCNSIWWEIADALTTQQIRFTKGIHVEDVVYTYIQSNLNNDNTDLFYLKNQTTGESHTIRVTAQGATQDNKPIGIETSKSLRISLVSDGSSVECILNRPIVSDSLSKFPTFQSTTITGCDDGRVGQAVLEPITNNSTLTKIFMFEQTKGGPVKKLAVPEFPSAQSPTAKLGDSFKIVQPPTSTTGATKAKIQ